MRPPAIYPSATLIAWARAVRSAKDTPSLTFSEQFELNRFDKEAYATFTSKHLRHIPRQENTAYLILYRSATLWQRFLISIGVLRIGSS